MVFRDCNSNTVGVAYYKQLEAKSLFIIEILYIKRTRPNTNTMEPVELGPESKFIINESSY